MQTNPILQRAEAKAGIVFANDMQLLSHDEALLAFDAEPGLATVANAGLPSLLSTFVDPDVLEIMVSPMKAAEIVGEAKKGDWAMQTAMFPVVERTGQTSSYGDYNNAGSVGSNTQFPQRQAYRYQTMLQYGDLEVERMGLAKIQWVAQLQRAAALAMRKFENLVYFKGVSGLQNYGLLNDPALNSTLTPGTKANGHGNVWVYNGAVNATALETFADIQAMYIQLVNQTNGVVEGLIDNNTPLKLCMHPISSVALTSLVPLTGTTSVADMLKKTWPNMTIETAVEYSTSSGYLVQLICPMLEGQQTAYAAFAEKMRSHRLIADTSSYKQKKSGSVWGSVIRQPYNIVGLLGV